MVRPCRPDACRLFARSRPLRSLIAPLVALSLVFGAFGNPAYARLAPDPEVPRLYEEGQTRDEAKDYNGAADSWTRLLNILPESGENQATRESVIINVLDAHLKAYNQLVSDKGTKDISHLQSGKATLDGYYADFKTVHGDRVAVSAAVQEKAGELEAALRQAEDAAATSAKPDPPEPVVDPGPQPKPDKGPDVIVLNAQNNGTGLIVGGAVVAALGIGALTMIPIGGARAKTANKDHGDAQEALGPGETTSTDLQRATFDGEQADAILISGAVLAPLLLGGAAAMIVFGVKARRRSQETQRKAIGIDSISPAVGRDYAGFGLRGRF